MTYLLKLLLISSLTYGAWAQDLKPVQLAIIIDDLGNSLNAGLNAIALPADITLAVMPHRKHSKLLAERAGRLGRDVLLHAPMSTVNKRFLGAGALDEQLSEEDFKRKLGFAIESIPYIKGVNNHMGSALTTNVQAMSWVMQVLKPKSLFFVDSRTSAASVGYATAQQMGLASATRDIFLDNDITTEHIHQQFKKAIAVAEQYGSAIAIGHPHAATINYLAHVLPQLQGTHVNVVKVSDLVKTNTPLRPHDARERPAAIRPDLDAFVQELIKRNAPAAPLQLTQLKTKPVTQPERTPSIN
ncbi:divergent polysaccharide deacetylase family protein [Oceaniserpentilla sp. 4NH20-0058]|uniref:divergent polysaccharide deacetylase family protein n=1 Tax=Oceaniserpentilla sp. 4NH20-0058 TaxID=3127660 RepID=UPI00310C1BE3